jgi:hypothetical protein
MEIVDDVKLIVRPNKEHGWITMFWDIRKFADFFDQHLRTDRQQARRRMFAERC